MKTIGIIGALDKEVTFLKDAMEIISAKQIIGAEFYMGKLSGKNIVLVRSGVGKVCAAICTQVLVDLYGVDCIINTGVAGGVYKELEVGDVVISSDLVQHDFDTTKTGDPLGYIPYVNETFFKADEELVTKAREAFEKVESQNKIYVNRIATGDQFISDVETKQKIWSNFKAYCAEMEGASIAQTCYLNKIPFAVIRVISDKADESANDNFEEFTEKCALTSSKVVEQILELI